MSTERLGTDWRFTGVAGVITLVIFPIAARFSVLWAFTFALPSNPPLGVSCPRKRRSRKRMATRIVAQITGRTKSRAMKYGCTAVWLRKAVAQARRATMPSQLASRIVVGALFPNQGAGGATAAPAAREVLVAGLQSH